MFFPEPDITQWKQDLQQRDIQRKNAQEEAMKTQFVKPVTWRDVKQKEIEYHPLLQKYAKEEKENQQTMKETNSWKHRSDLQRKNVEKYLPEYNIINLEKDSTVPTRTVEAPPKTRLAPAAQVDYNIITNNKLDDFHFQNLRFNVDAKKKESRKPHNGNAREFNIISNKYFTDHDNKLQNDNSRAGKELADKFSKTRDYNPVLAEFYNKEKEAQFIEARTKAQAEHGKDVVEKLPPTIKNRESIIFDPTREVPDAIKILDQKKKDAMKKYELRYKVEEQLKERDLEFQDKTNQMKLNRINDKKFTEHLDKGFDIITMNDYDKSQLKYQAKPTQTKWEKLKLTSNPTLQPQQLPRAATEKASLTSSDLKQARTYESGYNAQSTQALDTNAKPGWKDIRSASAFGQDTAQSDFLQAKEYKTAYQRAKEPTYNLADKYNQYCVPPQRVVDDFKTRTLPQVKIADNSLKFGLTKTGGFKRGESTSS